MDRSDVALTLVATVVLAAACSGADRRAAQPPQAAIADAAGFPGPGQAPLQRLRGEVVSGADGVMITPCGAGRAQPLVLAPQAQAFVERFGKTGAAAAFFLDGWGREQGGRLQVDAVERAHAEGPRCDAVPEDAMFVARGNEPFWSLAVDAAGWKLQRPGSDALHAEAAATRSGEGYAWQSAAPAARVEIVPRYCADSMADAATGWQAKLVLGDETLQGCAYRGAAALP